MSPATCPSRTQLHEFLVGTLPPDDADTIDANVGLPAFVRNIYINLHFYDQRKAPEAPPIAQVLQDEEYLPEERRRSPRDPHERGELAHDDHDPGPDQEPLHHRSRDEVDQEPEPEDPGQESQHSHQQGCQGD